ncbi:YbaB/EbfC family nucleoid-associated protein [Streptomyces sp. PTM05]|uniref:YbaB/EbfC family nucleoid-associated protein n=1 Tax=Streptantibioticus parmotrematis TaxID=2873249 RepID=A0ABS7R4A0_9ACTN|nr:YbaB/EbfC family nucleoid-associated protein [Streptantibioticus parmotrematis]MBY8888869.1 YbaB/EbfC family nucleoid-associated protein [Streptantibioticus parmotrematis]
MSSPYDQEIEDLLALYRKQREEAVETRRRINEVTGTATAPRQTVKATVNAQGELTAIEFPTGAYHRMAPKELSEALMTTIRQARANALEAVAELTSLNLPAGVKVTDLLEGKVDATALLPQEPGAPDEVREYIEKGRPEMRGGGAR